MKSASLIVCSALAGLALALPAAAAPKKNTALPQGMSKLSPPKGTALTKSECEFLGGTVDNSWANCDKGLCVVEKDGKKYGLCITEAKLAPAAGGGTKAGGVAPGNAGAVRR